MTLLLFEGTGTGSGSSSPTYQMVGRQMGVKGQVGGVISWFRVVIPHS